MDRKRQREKRMRREDFLAKSQRFFNENVLSLSREGARVALLTNRKVRQMWKMGLPPQTRGMIWQIAVGNELRISRDLFLILKNKQVQKSDNSNDNNGNDDNSGVQNGLAVGERDSIFTREQSIGLIDVDLMRTFPALQFFQEGGPLHDSFREVLECYAKFRPDVGYVQGSAELIISCVGII